MNETDIRKYAGLMKELGLTGLEITEDNKVVRLERAVPVSPAQVLKVPDSAPEPVSGQTGNMQEGQADYVSVIPQCRWVLCSPHRKWGALCVAGRPGGERQDSVHHRGNEADERDLCRSGWRDF